MRTGAFDTPMDGPPAMYTQQHKQDRQQVYLLWAKPVGNIVSVTGAIAAGSDIQVDFSIDGRAPATVRAQTSGGAVLFDSGYLETWSPHTLIITLRAGSTLVLESIRYEGADQEAPPPTPTGSTTSTSTTSTSTTTTTPAPSSSPPPTTSGAGTGSIGATATVTVSTAPFPGDNTGNANANSSTTRTTISTGTIIGAAIGGVAVLLLIIIAVILLRRRSRRSRAIALHDLDPPLQESYGANRPTFDSGGGSHIYPAMGLATYEAVRKPAYSPPESSQYSNQILSNATAYQNRSPDPYVEPQNSYNNAGVGSDHIATALPDYHPAGHAPHSGVGTQSVSHDGSSMAYSGVVRSAQHSPGPPERSIEQQSSSSAAGPLPGKSRSGPARGDGRGEDPPPPPAY